MKLYNNRNVVHATLAEVLGVVRGPLRMMDRIKFAGVMENPSRFQEVLAALSNPFRADRLVEVMAEWVTDTSHGKTALCHASPGDFRHGQWSHDSDSLWAVYLHPTSAAWGLSSVRDDHVGVLILPDGTVRTANEFCRGICVNPYPRGLRWAAS